MSSSVSLSPMAGSEAKVTCVPTPVADLPTFFDRPTGVDLELAAFMAGEARDFPMLRANLEACGCAICREALRILGAE